MPIEVSPELFSFAKGTDMELHAPLLAMLGSGLVVCEIGFRTGISARAFLTGRCQSLFSFDIADCSTDAVRAAANAAGIGFYFCQIDSSSGPPSPFRCELLFIDGDHSYEGVASDLRLWTPIARRWVVLHDTYESKHPGVAKALSEFLASSEDWQVVHVEHRCHGLVVLRRKS